jgi:hypothetical protein
MPSRAAICLLALAGAFGALGGPGRVQAASLYANPSLSLEESWDSNVLNAPKGNEESDFIFRAKPRLTLSLGMLGTHTRVGGGIEMERYGRHEELNKVAATKDAGLATLEPVQLTSRLTVSPSARFIETQDETRRNELAREPLQDLPPSEFLVTRRVRTREWQGALKVSYVLSPTLKADLTGGASKREFLDEAPGLVDSEVFKGTAALLRKVTPRLFSGVFAEASRNEFAGLPATKTYAGGILAQYALSPHHALDARVGASYIDQPEVGNEPANREWTPYARLSLDYEWMDFRARLRGSYEPAGGGSLGRMTRRGNVSLSLEDRMTPAWTWRLSASMQNNRSIDREAVTDGSRSVFPERSSARHRKGRRVSTWTGIRSGSTSH